MATDVIMPQMGFDMKEGKVLRWLKREGEQVNRGEAIAEIETDKATVEVEAFTGGVLGRIYVTEGTTVPVGELIGVITAPGEQPPAARRSQAAPVANAPTAPPPGQATASAAAPPPGTATPPPPAAATVSPQAPPAAPRREGRVAISPVARKVAEDAGVALEEIESNVSGTGPSGRITKEDVEGYVAKRKAAPTAAAPSRAPQPAMPEVAPQGIAIVVPQGLSPMRQAIARRMSLSKILAPHFYVTVQVDMGRAMALRQELNTELTEAERISVNDMVIKAVALALKKYPHFNVAVLPEGLKPYPNISIGIAVALPDGLVAPGLPDTGSKTLREISVGTRDLIERARNGRMRPEEAAGGSFSVSNMGMYDVQTFTAIITPPNSAALSIGSVKPTPVVRGDQIVVAQMMGITLSSDHRAVDGAQSAIFVNEVRRLLEKPTGLLL